jgi:hypothetical protein
MDLVDRMGFAQRIIVIVALGLGLEATGTFITELGSPAANFGWFGYAPLTRSIQTVGSTLSDWEQLLVWLALITVWTAASLFLLRARSAIKP